MSLVLYPYQEEGVKWMTERENAKPAGGLLLDECGLGKTAQVIATLVKNPQPKTLVVVPVNLMQQWKDQLAQWAPEHAVLIFHGPQPAIRRRPVMKYLYDLAESSAALPLIVITSYGKIVDRKFEKRRRKLIREGRLNREGKKLTGSSLLHQVEWSRIVLDEAHLIRNVSTVRSRYILKLKSRIRWALTATPIHNGIQDYEALLLFLGLSKFDIAFLMASHPVLEKYLSESARKLTQGRMINLNDMSIQTIGNTLTTHDELTLRRTKRVFTEPILGRPHKRIKVQPSLPSLDVHILEIPMSQAGRQFYGRLEQATRLELVEFLNGEPRPEVREQFMFELVLRLRQATVNPRLVLAGYKRKFEGRFPISLIQQGQEPNLTIARVREIEKSFYETLGVPSKTRALCQLMLEHRGEQSIVFCEFKEEMGFLQRHLSQSGIRSILYDGSMTVSQRHNVVQKLKWNYRELRDILEGGHFFPRTDHVPVEIILRILEFISYDTVLVQINSGNAGLNLQMCSRVYFTSPTWNPCTEIQAISRAHRCGQQLPVRAIKLVASRDTPTIDARIIEVQQQKRTIMSDILADSAILDNGIQDSELLLSLFGVEENFHS